MTKIKTHLDQTKTTANSRANTMRPYNPQGAALQPPTFLATTSVAQKQDKGALSVAEAKKIIIKATNYWLGTDESAIYDAIRRCSSHKSLMYDGAVIKALNGDMKNHELWKCHLLMEYGDESNFPASINALWKATAGGGTNEAAVFAELESMDHRAKNSFGLKYILRVELSGEELQRALDLIATSDSISGNIYGSAKKGEEKLVVNEKNLRKLIGSQFVGAASEKLKGAMIVLYNRPTGFLLNAALSCIESVRGLAPGSALGQYNTAIAKQKAGIARYKKYKEDAGQVYDHAVDNPSPALDVSKHKDFTASNAQLRFGKIIGDVFGIDAVFGSLISPTGGMAGAGNARISTFIVPKEGAVATHGAIHDAAGYLYNCHGIGPGYDYLKTEAGADPANPLAGQTTTKWWIKEFKKKGKDVDWTEKKLSGMAYIGAAFAKKYGELNMTQKKKALKVMAGTFTIILAQADITNTDRINKITELMNSCNDDEKTILADYFYKNNGFDTIGSVYPIMKPYVSEDVYDNYLLLKGLSNIGR